MLNRHTFKYKPLDHGSILYIITMCIKGCCLLYRNICSAAGRFLQHQCLLRVFWAGLHGTMSGYEVLWQLHLLPQVLNLLTALTSCFQCCCSPPRFLSQIPQTGLGPTWDGGQRPPIWGPHRRRWERQRHPLRPCKDHGWRERRDRCWERQAHGACESLRHQPLPSMSLFLPVSRDKCMNPGVIFEFRLCCRQTWLHQVGMSLKSTSGTWTILALQWHQDQKPRCFIILLSYWDSHIWLFWPCQSIPNNGGCVVSCMQMLFLTVVVWLLSESPWRTSASCPGTDRSSTSWPQPTPVGARQSGTCVRMTSSLKSATTATGYVPPPRSDSASWFSLLSAGPPSYVCRCVSLDALLWVNLEPRSSNSADFGLWGRPDACHPDVGFTFCYLSSQDFRESHTVNQHQQCCRIATRILESVGSFNT